MPYNLDFCDYTGNLFYPQFRSIKYVFQNIISADYLRDGYAYVLCAVGYIEPRNIN